MNQSRDKRFNPLAISLINKMFRNAKFTRSLVISLYDKVDNINSRVEVYITVVIGKFRRALIINYCITMK